MKWWGSFPVLSDCTFVYSHSSRLHKSGRVYCGTSRDVHADTLCSTHSCALSANLSVLSVFLLKTRKEQETEEVFHDLCWENYRCPPVPFILHAAWLMSHPGSMGHAGMGTLAGRPGNRCPRCLSLWPDSGNADNLRNSRGSIGIRLGITPPATFTLRCMLFQVAGFLLAWDFSLFLQTGLLFSQSE